MQCYFVDDNFKELGLRNDLIFNIGAIDDENDGISSAIVG